MTKNIAARISTYRDFVLEENQRQNLTTVTEAGAFIETHVLDVIELHQFFSHRGRYLDLGSGMGVPGLLSALINAENEWVLAESEFHKAEFLLKTVKALGLANVEVFHGRAEVFLSRNSVDFVCSRAVGSAIKVFRLLEKCSTWNTLILFKGPKWEEEKKVLLTEAARGVSSIKEHFYKTRDNKSRVIAAISRE